MDNPLHTRISLLPMALMLVVAPLTINDGVSDPTLLPQYLAMCIGLGVSMATRLFLLQRKSQQQLTNFKPLWAWPGIAFLVIALISCTWARNPWEGFFEWTKFALCMLWALILSHFLQNDPKLWRWLPRLLLIFLGIALAQGLMQLAQVLRDSGGLSHLGTYQVTSFFGHRNLFAEVITLTFPFLLFLIWQEHRFWRIAAGLLAFASLLMLLLLQVRSTWLALGFALALGLPAMAIATYKALAPKQMQIRLLALVVFMALAVGIGWLMHDQVRLTSSLVEVGSSIGGTNYGSAQERLVLWKKTWTLIQDRPLKGYGLGAWKIELGSTGYEGERIDMQLGKGNFVRAHNDYLQLIAETGWPGGLAWAATLLLALAMAWRVLRRAQNDEHRRYAVAAGMSIAAYMVVAAFSFPMERIAHHILLGTNLGIIASLSMGLRASPSPMQLRPRWRDLGLAIGILAVGGFAWLAMQKVKADQHLLAALNARSRGDWPSMERELKACASPLHTLDPTAAPFAWYRGSAKFQQGRSEESLQDFQAAYRDNPYHLHVLNNLGVNWLQLGHADSALPYLRMANQLSPRFEEVHLNLGITYFYLGDFDQAELMLQQSSDTAVSPPRQQLEQQLFSNRLATLLAEVTEPYLLDALRAVYKQPHWAKDIIAKARAHHRSMREQLLAEAIYALEVQDKMINLDEAAEWRAKYLQKQQ